MRWGWMAAAAVGVAMAPALAEAPAVAGRTLATAEIVGGNGAIMGTARVTEAKGGLVLLVDASGVAPGPHGIHIHAIGKCEAPGFTSAGGHLDTGGHKHGTLNPAGPHMGDLPNLTADAKGMVHATITLPMNAATFGSTVLDADGAAVVIHAVADDYKTDPAGASGARIGCGVLRAG